MKDFKLIKIVSVVVGAAIVLWVIFGITKTMISLGSEKARRIQAIRESEPEYALALGDSRAAILAPNDKYKEWGPCWRTPEDAGVEPKLWEGMDHPTRWRHYIWHQKGLQVRASNPERITLKHFDALKPGMSLYEAKAIMGSPGTVIPTESGDLKGYSDVKTLLWGDPKAANLKVSSIEGVIFKVTGNALRL